PTRPSLTTRSSMMPIPLSLVHLSSYRRPARIPRVRGMAPNDGSPLDGRTALVTGASRGIGEATARALDRAGARVAICARSRDDLERVAAELACQPVVIEADLAAPSAPGEVAAAALDAFGGRVDVLVNNAAAAARLPTVDTDATLIDKLLAVNVRAPLLLIAALIPGMVEQGWGSI